MILDTLTVKNIREFLKYEYEMKNFTTDKSGSKTIEIIGASFIADESGILTNPNEDYIERELEWYKSCSRYVKDIPGKTPVIWENVSSNTGKINSNYGWCIYTEENGDQYNNTKNALIKNPNTRQAIMIYNRPTMHIDSTIDDMSDFMCTFANAFFIRDNELISHFIMRSNDAVYGYGNDYAWAKFVQEQLCNDLKDVYPDLKCGDIIWTASNLHVYERHFDLI